MSLGSKSLLISALATMLFAGCSKSSDSSSTAATTFSLGGNVTLSRLAAASSDEEEQNFSLDNITNPAGGIDSVGKQATLCSDNFYYKVVCVAWTAAGPSAAVEGNITNCGASSGGTFTVAGLPLNTEITCKVHKSSDGVTFKTMATLDLPAASMSGKTDTLKAGGDIVLTVSVSSTGTVTSVVASGTNNGATEATTGAASVSPATLSGFYNLSCPTDLGTGNSLKCKCFILNNNESNDTCYGNNAVNVTATNMTINLNVYQGVVVSDADFNGDSVVDMPAGAAIFAGTIWASSNAGSPCTTAGSCTSARVGAGEGLPTFGGILGWTSNAASIAAAAAMTWTTSAALPCPGAAGGTATTTIPAVPGSGATRAGWLTWLQTTIDNYVTACNAVDGANVAQWNGCNVASVANGVRSADAFCAGNFTWQVLGNVSTSVNIPRLRWDWSQNCNASGCSNTITNTQLSVEGVEFNGAGATTKYNPEPKNRYVFDQWMPNAAGTGGSLKSHSDDYRSYSCNSLPSGASCSAAAIAATAWVECATGDELIIKFLPSTTGFNVVFNQQTVVRYGKYRGGAVNGSSAYDVCVSYLASGTVTPEFMAKATKL